jgi:hypothetical protein
MKVIRCSSIEAIGSKVRHVTWGRFTLTLAPWKVLLFVETGPIPRTTIPDSWDIVIQRGA